MKIEVKSAPNIEVFGNSLMILDTYFLSGIGKGGGGGKMKRGKGRGKGGGVGNEL